MTVMREGKAQLALASCALRRLVYSARACKSSFDGVKGEGNDGESKTILGRWRLVSDRGGAGAGDGGGGSGGGTRPTPIRRDVSVGAGRHNPPPRNGTVPDGREPTVAGSEGKQRDIKKNRSAT
jgi:hypothetical protein